MKKSQVFIFGNLLWLIALAILRGQMVGDKMFTDLIIGITMIAISISGIIEMLD